MSNLVISLAMGGGIGALALVAAAYWWGVKSGRAMQSDVDEAKIVKKTRTIHDEMLKEVTASDAQEAAKKGEF